MRRLIAVGMVVACSGVLVAQAAVGATAVPTVRGKAAADVAAAKVQWEGAGFVGGGALQDVPLQIAQRALRRAAVAAAPGDKSMLDAAIAALVSLQQIPDAGITPAQEQQSQAAQSALSQFFGVAMSSAVPSGALYNEADVAWEKEPAKAASGATPGPLRRTAALLAEWQHRDPSANPALGAVIADIRSLEVAPRSALVARAVTLPQEEVAYVNFFFGFAADINAHFVLQSP